MKDDNTPEKINNISEGGKGDGNFPDWTLTPDDVDIEALLEEARREMEAALEKNGKPGESLEDYVERTMGMSLESYIEKTLAFTPGEADLSETRAFVMPRNSDAEADADTDTEADSKADSKAQGTLVSSETLVPHVTRVPSNTIMIEKAHPGEEGDEGEGEGEDQEAPYQPTPDETHGDPERYTQRAPAQTVRIGFSDADAAQSATFADISRTRMAAIEPIDWKKAEDEEAGYKGNEGRKTVTYGLTDDDVKDTISMERPPETEESPEIREFNERIRQRQKDNDRRNMRNRLRVKILLIAVAAGIFLFGLSLTSFFTIDAIEVRGNSHFTSEEIINIAHATPGRNLIYDNGSKEIIQYLEQNPYIKEAVVARKLPSTLVINVTERKQACALEYDDDYLVLDEDGILLKKTGTKPKITLIKGLVVSKIKLGESIGTKDRKLFEKTMELIRTMNDSDLYFVTVDMLPEKADEGVVRAYIYDTFIVKGQYDLLLENLENGRLHLVVEKLFDQKIRRGTITFTENGTISFEPGL